MILTEANFVYSTNTRIQNAINKLVNGAPESMDTLGEIGEILSEMAQTIGALQDQADTSTSAITTINRTIEDNELTTSQALNDLNTRVEALENA